MTYYIFMTVIMISAVLLMAYNYKLSRDIKKIKGSVTIYRKISVLVQKYELVPEYHKRNIPLIDARIKVLGNMVDDENSLNYKKVKVKHSSFLKCLFDSEALNRLHATVTEKIYLEDNDLPNFMREMGKITNEVERTYFPYKWVLYDIFDEFEAMVLRLLIKIVSLSKKSSKYSGLDKDGLDGSDEMHYNGDTLEVS